MSVFRDLSSWKEEQFLHETGRFCEILWNLFKIPKSVWQSPASVLWPDFPVCIASVRGPDLIMWSETVLVKLLNHHFSSHWPQSHFLGAVFQFRDTIYSQIPHQWLNVSLFYSIIYFQKRYLFSTLTIWDLNLCQQNDSFWNVGFQQVAGRDFGDEGQ